jgi:hypothetical protein
MECPKEPRSENGLDFNAQIIQLEMANCPCASRASDFAARRRTIAQRKRQFTGLRMETFRSNAEKDSQKIHV